jgi:ATP-binding cassette subfamily F protein uup
VSLLTVLNAELAFGLHPLLDGAALSIEPGERIGLIGRNGTGKSSLMGALAGRLTLDGGEVRRRERTRLVLVEQEPDLPPAADLADSLLARARQDPSFDHLEDWALNARLGEFLERLSLSGALDPAACSGGERKRAVLALAFALEPDLLLLDEPTNHLDIGAIEALESLLVERQRGNRAALCITHDRRFLDRVATRIVELDRGRLLSYPGDYSAFVARREETMAAQAQANRRFDRFWAQEEVWIRKGIEARRTRNEGRVRRLEQLREARAQRRDREGRARMALATGESSGRLVAELEGVEKSLGGRALVRGLDLRLMRGDRLALIGPNGAGKTTLLRLILGQLAPDQGKVRLGTRLEVAYFDQLRARLDPERTLVETVSPGSDWIEIGGQRRHVLGYLEDFLFPAQRAQAPVRMLSGGERNRLLLARLFAQPANVLVLDEPTNDLDIETLELLESTLADYAGTVLMVSHDRSFVDQIATQCLATQGDGHWRESVGGYSDWMREQALAPLQTPSQTSSQPAGAPIGGRAAAGTGAAVAATPDAPGAARRPERMSFKEQRELESLPGQIEACEQEQAQLHERMAGPDYHREGPARLREDRERDAGLTATLERLMERWVELESRADARPSP